MSDQEDTAMLSRIEALEAKYQRLLGLVNIYLSASFQGPSLPHHRSFCVWPGCTCGLDDLLALCLREAQAAGRLPEGLLDVEPEK